MLSWLREAFPSTPFAIEPPSGFLVPQPGPQAPAGLGVEAVRPMGGWGVRDLSDTGCDTGCCALLIRLHGAADHTLAINAARS